MGKIINSLLETDLYKFTVSSCFFEHFANTTARYTFKDRKGQIPTDSRFAEKIRDAVGELCELRFKKEELDFLFGLRFMRNKLGFREYLRNFKFNRDWIHIKGGEGELNIYTDEAPIIAVSLFETFILSIVNETYCRENANKEDSTYYEGFALGGEECRAGGELAIKTAERFKAIRCPFIEMGVRRRINGTYQEQLIKELRKNPLFLGTSNVYLAMKLDVKPMGTMSHELLQTGQGLQYVPVADSQRYMFDTWAKHFNGDLGIALSDCLGDEKFLEDFSCYYAKLFDGVRHDSGDPIAWAKRMIRMYTDYGIDVRTKKLIFSDSLNLEKANDIYHALVRWCDEKKVHLPLITFGIGTALTNPLAGTNIVMKQVSCNGRPTAKISANPGKSMCENPSYMDYLKKVCHYKTDYESVEEDML